MTQLQLVHETPRYIDFPSKFELGMRIHCKLYGGKDGTITAIHGEQSPDTISITGGFIHSGGNAELDIAWDKHGFSNKTPECIARGVQWKMLSGYRNPEEAISESNAYVAAATKAKEEEKLAFEKAVEDIKEEYSYLTIDNGEDRNIVQKNMRLLLKKQFPGVKFKVTKDGYSSRNVSWTDGPTSKEVEAFAFLFQEGRFNGMEDIYEYSESPFNRAFGGCQYVFTRRETSDKLVAKAIDSVWEQYGKDAFEGYEKPSLEDYKQGKLGNMHSNNWGRWFTDFLWEELSKIK